MNLFSKLLAVALLAVVPVEASGGTTYGTAYASEITSIYDADTFRVNINGWSPVVGQNIPIRVYGIDTPEIRRSECQKEKELALVARDRVVEILEAGTLIELRDIGRDKYFRLLADVYVDGNRMADTLISEKLAYEYYGGTKQSWCK